MKRSEALLMQYRKPPVSFGPSGNTCPRCASPIFDLTSVRTIPCEVSATSLSASESMGRLNAGHPHPE